MSRDRKKRGRQESDAAPVPSTAPEQPAAPVEKTPAPSSEEPAGEAGASFLPPGLKPWLPPLAIVLLVLVFFSPFLLQGKVFLAADTLSQFYPWRAYAPQGFAAHNTLITDPVNQGYSFHKIYNEQLKKGHFVTWSPYVLGGIPAFNGRSYPPTLFFHRFFATHVAMTLNLLTHVLLMGLFMYLFLREIGAGARGAVFGAAAYMFNGCAMVWLSFETVVPHAAYVPLLLLIMERYQGRRRLFHACLGAIVLGLVLLLGHIQYTLYIGMTMALYGAFLLVRAIVRKAPLSEFGSLAGCAAVTAVGGLLIGALELLPTWEVINYSSRVQRSFDFNGLFTTLGRLPYRWLVTLIFPDYFGSPVRRFNLIPSSGGEYINYNELCLYLGIPTLFALLALAIRPRTAHGRFFLGLTVAITAMLAGSILFYPFFKLFPGLDKLNPLRMIFIFVFAAAAAAGLGVRNIEEASGKLRWALLGSALALTGTVVLLAFTASSGGAISFFNREQVGSPSTAPWLFDQLRRLRSLPSPIIVKPLVIALAAGALVSLWVWFGKRRWSTVLPALLIALLGYDLITFGWGYNTLVGPKQIYPTTPSLEFLQRQPKPFRVVSDAGRGLYVNVLQPFGIQEIGGYASVYPERINKLMSSIEYGQGALQGLVFDRWVMFRNILHPLFDLLNVRYVLTAPNARLAENPRYRLAFTGDLTIYENLQALPRAFAVHRPVQLRDTAEIIRYMNSGKFDPRAEVILEEPPDPAAGAPSAAAAPSRVEIRRYSFDEVEIAAEMSAPGWVVLSDSFFPGWEAAVDGRNTKLLRADGALRAVAVPSGPHAVTFRYRPAAVGRGRLVSLLGFLLAVAGMSYSVRARRRK
jgi:hypothetical protein